MKNFYSIDTAGNIFPAVQGEDNSSFFRIAAILKEPIDSALFQKAVEASFQRFSFFFVRLRRGVFWNYLEVTKDLCTVQQEKDLPCSPIKIEKGKSNLIRFYYFQNRLTIEVSHIITDGTGCFELLKAVLYSYITQKEGFFDNEGKIISLDSIPTIKDYESSFSRYTDLSKSVKKQKRGVHKSYRIKGFIPLEKGTNVITGCASIQSVKVVSKQYGTTITGYLCALLMFSIYSARIKYEKNKRPLVVAVPANLRKLFPSESLRNFFAVPNICYTFTPLTTFENVIESVNEQMKNLFSKENMENELRKYASYQGNTLASLVPLGIKKVFLKLGFSLFGESKKSITLTNLGLADFPAEMQKHIEHLEFILYPTKRSPMNVAVASFSDTLSISFSLAINETDIIRSFFVLLQEHIQTQVSVYSTKKGISHDL